MPHVCKEPGCTFNCFGGGYCKYHQGRRKQNTPKNTSGIRFKPRSKSKGIKIPPESKTRQKQRKIYDQVCKELTEEIREVNEGKDYCFFSGQEIKGRISFHHFKGRAGKYYTDKRYLVPVLNDPHLEYHRMTVEQLKGQPWFEEWMERLKNKDIESYQK